VEKKLPERLAQMRALWPDQAPLRLMFQDEARFGRINDVRRCWAPRPVRPLCQAMLTHEATYAYAAVGGLSGELDSLILPHVNTHCMQLFLDEVGQRHPNEHIVRVHDGAGWHASSTLAPPANMWLLSLPASPHPKASKVRQTPRRALLICQSPPLRSLAGRLV
jgi:hypothetical protein